MTVDGRRKMKEENQIIGIHGSACLRRFCFSQDRESMRRTRKYPRGLAPLPMHPRLKIRTCMVSQFRLSSKEMLTLKVRSVFDVFIRTLIRPCFDRPHQRLPSQGPRLVHAYRSFLFEFYL